jgi:hypothetical protein
MLAAQAIQALMDKGERSEEQEVLAGAGALLVNEAFGHLRAMSGRELKIKVLK